MILAGLHRLIPSLGTRTLTVRKALVAGSKLFFLKLKEKVYFAIYSVEGDLAIARNERGFATMDPEEQRQIASKGGRASHGGHRESWEENGGRGERGGSYEQHARAGRQSHKNQ